VLRALGRDDALAPLAADVSRRLDAVSRPELCDAADTARAALARTLDHAAAAAGASRDEVEAGARGLAVAVGRVTAAALLLEHADWALAHEPDRAEAAAAAAAARRWCAGDLAPLRRADGDAAALSPPARATRAATGAASCADPAPRGRADRT
jgi:hypothetical protein